MLVLRSFLFCLFIAGIHNAPQEELPGTDLIHADVRMDDMLPCPDSPEPVVTVANVTLEFYNRTQLLVNGVFVVKEVVDNILIKLFFQKCDSKQQIDSCQHMLSTSVDNLCEKLPENGTDMEKFTKHMHNFTRECPLQPGSYEIEGAPLDTSTFSDNPIIFGYWIADANLYMGDEYLGCTRVSASIVKKRRKGGVL